MTIGCAKKWSGRGKPMGHEEAPGDLVEECASEYAATSADTAKHNAKEGKADNPLNTFLALASGAGAQWTADLESMQGKDLEKILADELGEASQDSSEKTHLLNSFLQHRLKEPQTRTIGPGTKAEERTYAKRVGKPGTARSSKHKGSGENTPS